MNIQISMDDYLRQEEPPVTIEIPIAHDEQETVFKIPDDVWQGRCQLCVHKNAEQNTPIPLWAVHKLKYSKVIPCRIMSISRPNDRPGECMSFAPRIDVYGICATCRYNNIFHDGFCMKPDHSEQHRVYWGTGYGGDALNVDYYTRHRLSVCDDYEPGEYAKENQGR